MKPVLLLASFALVLAGCATQRGEPSAGWIPGTLTCVDDGTVMPFRIQKKWAFGGSATGGVWATNAVTREQFSGQYTAIIPRAFGYARAVNSYGQSATAYGTARSGTANAAASLKGDKGTVISLEMDIATGWSPHGIGGGNDNKKRTYRVQF